MPDLERGRIDRVYRWGMVGVLLLALGLRVYALSADLPLHISLSQGATTDGPSTVSAGRNMALFGDWNPHGDVRNPLYLYPAMSWLSFLVFHFLGVGFWQANLLAVISGLLTIVFTAAFAREQFGRRAALLTALFLSVSYLYLMYNRTPMAYTPLTCGMAAALYFWQKGLRSPGWFFLSGLTTGFTIFFVKILGAAMLPAALIGLLLLTWRRYRASGRISLGPLLLYGLGLLLGGGLWFLFIYYPESRLLSNYFGDTVHTFAPSLGLEENIRFALQSVLQFGVRSGFFLQLLPLFVVAYLYTFSRIAQMMTSDRKPLALGEIVALLHLLGVAALLLGSANRPTRYLIVLIPPMSLVGGLALDKGMQLRDIRWPQTISRWLPVLAMFALTYFYYQILAALVKAVSLVRFQASLTDGRVIAGGGTLFTLFGGALALGIVTTLFFLQKALRGRGRRIPWPSGQSRRRMAALIVVCALLIDGYQYLTWARNPQFSLVEASRQIESDLGPGATLGGPYAYVLALENELPAIRFYPFQPYEVVAALQFTHILTEADSIFNNGPFNDQRLYENMPELMERARLVETYWLRGYWVKAYAVE